MTIYGRVGLALIPLLLTAPAFAEDASQDGLHLQEHHTFTREEARVRVQQLLDYWSQRFGVQRSWHGDVARIRGRVMGVAIDARLVVGDHDVKAEANDPGVLFRKTAFEYVHRKLRKYLSPTYDES